MTKLQKHLADWAGCQRCPLGAVRRNMVFLRGKVPCDVLFVGEAPGVSEDVHGIPFVGPAGHLQDRINALAFGDLKLTHAFVNLVCCFPRNEKEAGTNEPPDEAIIACQPRLAEFVEIARPRLIVCVGSLAHRWIGTEHNRKALKVPDGCRTIHIEHPASIIRANVAQRSLAERRAVVVLANALNAL